MKQKKYDDFEILSQLKINDYLIDGNNNVYEIFSFDFCHCNGSIYRIRDIIKKVFKVYSGGYLKYDRERLRNEFEVNATRSKPRIST